MTTAVTLNAQSDRGTITGLVSDSSGAVVARATVLVTNTATNTSREALTSDTGKYVFQELPAAVYSLAIKQAGFRTYRQDGITVGVSQTVTQDVILFNDTIQSNIGYGRPDVSREQIEQTARAAYAHDFIMERGGYDNVTVVIAEHTA